MKVLLIIPPYPIDEFPSPSTGSMYLAAALLGEGHSVEVLDLLVSEASRHKVEETIRRVKPDVVGITSVTMTFPAAAAILSWVRRAKADSVTVMGGPHVSFAPARSLSECAAADIIVRGEGEQTLLELVRVLERGGDIGTVRGIAFRQGDAVVSTPKRPLIHDLDALPLPVWDRLPLARYRALEAKIGVLSSRGCPYGCIFCVGHRMMGRKGRFRNPQRVAEEMAWLAGYGFTEIGIDDDLFTLRPAHAMGVCEEIRARGLSIKWHAFARVDTIRPDLLKAMAEAGCTGICYGVESGSQEVLDGIGKRITLEQVKRAVRETREAGMEPLASFILGLPGETPRTLRETIAFARSLGCRFGLHVLAPFPGTRVRDEAHRYGMRILTDDWSLYDANRPVCLTDSIRHEHIDEIIDQYNAELAGYIRGQEARVRSRTATEEEIKEVAKRRRDYLAWDILHQDLLERHGAISGSFHEDDSIQILARKLSQRLSHPISTIRETLEEWARQGLIRSEPVGAGASWRWAYPDELSLWSRSRRAV